MKYYTTTISLFLLSFFLVLILLYYGGLTRKVEKKIANIKSEINYLNDLILVNELEFTAHIRPSYLNKLEKIYLSSNYEKNEELNIVGINSFNATSIKQVLKVKVKLN